MPIQSPYTPLGIPEKNILHYLFPEERQEPTIDKPIWIEASNTSVYLTRRTLLQWATRLAIGFDKLRDAEKRLVVQPGDVVMIFSSNQVMIPVAYLGTVGSGRIFSGANATFTVRELVYQIRDSEPKILLVHPTLVDTAVAASKEAGLSLDRVFQFSSQKVDTNRGIQDWSFLLESSEESSNYAWPEMSGEMSKKTIAVINYSSGTTGLPKGVCISHYNLIANVEQTIFSRTAYKQYHGGLSEERWVGLLPLYHAYGQLYTILMATKLEAPVYILKQFEFEEYLRVSSTHRVTQLQIVPPIMILLAKRSEPGRYDLSHLESITCGAAPLSLDIQNKVSKRFNVPILGGWGMTELTCSGILVPGGVADDTGSIGVLIPNCESKIVDDHGEEVKDGEHGELLYRGPNTCLGYWRKSKTTAESFTADGWFKTGDIALHRNGWFWIVDRKKELIKVQGFQVAPAELEALLLENASIADAAVVGVNIGGEEYPRAYVVLEDHAKDYSVTSIQQWVQQRVSKYKQLVGGVSLVDEVPKSPSGKILRQIIREWAKRDASSIQLPTRVGSVIKNLKL